MIITVATLLPWRLVLLNRMSSHRSFYIIEEKKHEKGEEGEEDEGGESRREGKDVMEGGKDGEGETK